jgi:hypothetical protein
MLTELEKKIYECALEAIPRIKEKLKGLLVHDESEARYIHIPFFCDGVFDRLVYDKHTDTFTKILYEKGVGKGSKVEGINGAFSAYFDKTEICELDISKLENTVKA